MTKVEFRAAVEAAVRRYEDHMGKSDPLPALLNEIEQAADQYAATGGQDIKIGTDGSIQVNAPGRRVVIGSGRGIQIGNNGNVQVNSW